MPAAAGLDLAVAVFICGLGVAGLVDFERRNVFQATFALPWDLCRSRFRRQALSDLPQTPL
jgi:hypothetical protein